MSEAARHSVLSWICLGLVVLAVVLGKSDLHIAMFFIMGVMTRCTAAILEALGK